MEQNDKILETIRRLLALSTSSNEHEAALAAAKAQELMFKHNVQMQDVPDQQREEFTREFVKLDNSAGWKRSLLHVVTKYNFCKAIDLGSGRMAVIGERPNIETSVYIYQYLRGEIDRLADDEWNRYTGWVTSAKKWKGSFRIGAVEAVGKTLREQQRKDAGQNEQTQALVVVKDQALAEATQQYYPRLVKTGRRQNVNTQGYLAGQRAGANISIRQGVTAGGGKRTAGYIS